MGIHTQLMLAMSRLGQGNITCFIDKDEKVIGEKIRGKKICSPDALYNATEKDVVVIGAPTHAETMRKYLIEQIGFKGKVVVCGFGDVHLACPLQNQLI
jgi:FlaA1/EpsC-like NDP-sugar epimerase